MTNKFRYGEDVSRTKYKKILYRVVGGGDWTEINTAEDIWGLLRKYPWMKIEIKTDWDEY